MGEHVGCPKSLDAVSDVTDPSVRLNGQFLPGHSRLCFGAGTPTSKRQDIRGDDKATVSSVSPSGYSVQSLSIPSLQMAPTVRVVYNHRKTKDMMTTLKCETCDSILLFYLSWLVKGIESASLTDAISNWVRRCDLIPYLGLPVTT